jgi:DNA-binding GntR family transcriptional regulator
LDTGDGLESPTNANATAKGRHLPRVVFSDQVKQYIVEAVLNSELKPGDRIVESTMARDLGASQAPVCEAMRNSVLLGFLESKLHKGTSCGRGF